MSYFPPQMMPIRPPEDPKRHPTGSAQQGAWVTQDPKTKKPVYRRIWFVAALVILLTAIAIVLLAL